MKELVVNCGVWWRSGWYIGRLVAGDSFAWVLHEVLFHFIFSVSLECDERGSRSTINLCSSPNEEFTVILDYQSYSKCKIILIKRLKCRVLVQPFAFTEQKRSGWGPEGEFFFQWNTVNNKLKLFLDEQKKIVNRNIFQWIGRGVVFLSLLWVLLWSWIAFLATEEFLVLNSNEHLTGVWISTLKPSNLCYKYWIPNTPY